VSLKNNQKTIDLGTITYKSLFLYNIIRTHKGIYDNFQLDLPQVLIISSLYDT